MIFKYRGKKLIHFSSAVKNEPNERIYEQERKRTY